jgi:hypothetical protein
MGFLDKAKNLAGKGKDKADDVVDEHGDKVPDEVGNTYDKVSDAAEKIIPGEDAATAAD